MRRLLFFSLVVLGTYLYGARALATSTDVYLDYTGRAQSGKCVILLHGLARTSSSMDYLANTLAAHDFYVVNVDYPSRQHRVEVLSELAVTAGLYACRMAGSEHIHVVTHSLGGILIRHYLSEQDVPELDRIVMLAPPNHGSAVVDNLKGLPGFHWLNGPAVDQLGTDENSVPLQLGGITKDTAVIAGSRSINLYLSTYLENPDDGKVSVTSARLEGMCAMLVLPVSHPFIMKDEDTIEQTINYLKEGRFTAENAEYSSCPAKKD